MYKEIHPFWYDSFKARGPIDPEVTERTPQKEFYKECEPRVIDLSLIRQLQPEQVFDNSISLTRIKVSDDHLEDILVSREEGEEIKKLLLKNVNSSSGRLPEEVSKLTNVLRLLYELLRARLH